LVIPWLRVARDLLATTRVTIRVWPNDLDTNMHVNNGRYLTLADLGRADWFIRTGVYATSKRLGIFPVVGAAGMDARLPRKR
jgi:acyl-CoA thioesterase FadM